MGRAVHDEPFSKADFWATQYNVGEETYTDLPSYVNAGASIMNTDIVVWHMSPMHHEPRDEDGFPVPQSGGWVFWDGVAQIMWSGLDIRPRNLWDKTPLYPNN
jgi:Cu2+-containing amine oxidase